MYALFQGNYKSEGKQIIKNEKKISEKFNDNSKKSDVDDSKTSLNTYQKAEIALFCNKQQRS